MTLSELGRIRGKWNSYRWTQQTITTTNFYYCYCDLLFTLNWDNLVNFVCSHQNTSYPKYNIHCTHWLIPWIFPKLLRSQLFLSCPYLQIQVMASLEAWVMKPTQYLESYIYLFFSLLSADDLTFLPLDIFF